MKRSYWERGRVVVVGSLVLLLLLGVACGPTAPAGDTGNEEKTPLAPTPTVSPDALDDKADEEQKPTAVPPLTQKPDERTKPAPTRDIGDPASPTVHPEADPTQVQPDLSEGVNSGLPHPQGLDGCRVMNVFAIPYDEFQYQPWCMTAMMEDVANVCRGAGDGTEDEKRCARSRLADVPAYSLREVLVPCAGISDEDDLAQCNEQSLVNAGQHYTNLRSVWNDILMATVDDANVKHAFAALATCIREAGYDPPDGASPLPWQEKDETKGDDDAVRKRSIIDDNVRLMAIDRCAITTRFYEAQKDKWLSEIYRPAASDPHSVEPLLMEGMDDVLTEPGVPPFLTIRQFETNR